MIGHCIVWFVSDIQISLRVKIQSLSLLLSSCENFRPLAEAKCHVVWKMIVNAKSPNGSVVRVFFLQAGDRG